jgi:hypothetical protein
MSEEASTELKLYMLLLGSKAPGRHVEQHDFFFGVAHSLKELVPAIKSFWHGTGSSLHIDGWREVTNVDGYRCKSIAETGRLPRIGEQALFCKSRRLPGR